MSNLQYKETPIHPVRIGPNGAPQVSEPAQLDLVDKIERPAPSPPAAEPRRPNKPAPPVRSDLLTDQLVVAVQQVFKVVTARIAYHEAEAARLRSALKPYSEFAAPAPADGAAPSVEQDMATLIATVREIYNKGEQP